MVRREQVPLIITLSSLSSLGVGLLGPVYPIFVLNRFSASILDVGMLATVFGLVSAFFKTLAGKLVDAYGEKKVFFVGVMLGALCSLSYILAFELTHLYLIEFFFGIAYALQGPARLALIMNNIGGRRKRGLILGIFETTYDVAGSLAAIIAAVIASNFGFEVIFFACSCCQIVTALLVLKSRNI
ncbi:MFS transporter [Candidatus Bathyarchaeota archaeon]|nr:MFS transporter [Candidatus Bathyarchaeota archaeon]